MGCEVRIHELLDVSKCIMNAVVCWVRGNVMKLTLEKKYMVQIKIYSRKSKKRQLILFKYILRPYVPLYLTLLNVNNSTVALLPDNFNFYFTGT